MNSLQWILFIVGTLFFIYASWSVSLKAGRYHGIYRFFSFESILIIVLLNYPVWFKDPFSVMQILSWLLLTGASLLACLGFFQFFQKGKPGEQWEDTSELITTGLYKYIRHPLYLSLILGGFGAMLKDPGLLQVVLAVVNLLSIYVTAKVEEGEMIERFGDSYRNYKKNSFMFIPFLI